MVVWFYRARGDNQERADIDLAILCRNASFEDWLMVKNIIEDADTLLKIDCIRMDELPETSDLKIPIIQQGINWKLLKNILESKGVKVQYPKNILQEAFQGHLINHEQIWLKMLEDRNMTSHTYNEELADQIFLV